MEQYRPIFIGWNEKGSPTIL